MNYRTSDVVVIGAGIVGASVARRLAERGARVTVLERRQPAAGTTSTSFAWVNAHNKPPRPYHDLNAAGVAEHHRLAAEQGGRWFHATGCLQWAEDEAGCTALLDNVSRLQEWSYSAELIDRQQASELAPDLTLPDAAQFAFYPDEGWVEAPALTHALLEAAARDGANLAYPREVTAFLVRSGRMVGVATDQGDFPADLVVDCTGREMGRLLEPLGLRVGRRPSPGLLVATEPLPTCLDRVVLAPRLNLRPDGAGRVLLQASAVDDALAAEAEPWADPLICQGLVEQAASLMPVLAGARVEAARLGWRAMPDDGFSAVGPVPGVPGCYLVFTHSGVTLGPLLGRLVADEIISGRPAPMLDSFRPDRLISVMSSPSS